MIIYTVIIELSPNEKEFIFEFMITPSSFLNFYVWDLLTLLMLIFLIISLKI